LGFGLFRKVQISFQLKRQIAALKNQLLAWVAAATLSEHPL
jgi:hypothetical protein